MYFNGNILFFGLVFNIRKQHVVREDPFFYHLRYNLSCEEINFRYSKSRQYVVVNTYKEYFDLIIGIFSISYSIKEQTCYLKKLFILIITKYFLFLLFSLKKSCPLSKGVVCTA